MLMLLGSSRTELACRMRFVCAARCVAAADYVTGASCVGRRECVSSCVRVVREGLGGIPEAHAVLLS